MSKLARLLVLQLCLLIFTSACASGTATPGPGTLTPEPTLAATSTEIWFPPTATPSPKPPTPVVLPTPDMRPGLGDVTLEDDFNPDSPWTLFRVESGSAAIGINELTIAVVKPRVVLSSYYQRALPQDFYLEITINASLCRGEDMYGLLLRASEIQKGYRFIANCNGQVRFDWNRSGTIIPLRDWAASGQVPPGSPVEYRLGIWNHGNEMRFFINDFYQFSVEKLTVPDGMLGIFARSAADTPLTVNFSQLRLRQVITEAASGTSQ